MKRSSPRGSPAAGAKVAGVIAGLIVCVIGAVFLPPSYAAMRNARESRDWSEVEGVLIRVDRHSPIRGSAYLTVRYQYRFGDRDYEGDRISFGMQSMAQDHLRLGGEGSPLTVFVNPHRPQDSVLVAGADGGAKVLFGIGAGLLVLGVSVVWLSFAGAKSGVNQ